MRLEDFLLKEEEGTEKFISAGFVDDNATLGKVQGLKRTKKGAKDIYLKPYKEPSKMFIDGIKNQDLKTNANRKKTMIAITVPEEALEKSGNYFKVKDTDRIEKIEFINPRTGKWQDVGAPEEDEPFKGDAHEVQQGFKTAKKTREKWSGKNEK